MKKSEINLLSLTLEDERKESELLTPMMKMKSFHLDAEAKDEQDNNLVDIATLS
jgi:hypothetical protein